MGGDRGPAPASQRRVSLRGSPAWRALGTSGAGTDGAGAHRKKPQVRSTYGFLVVLVELRGFEPLIFSTSMRRSKRGPTRPYLSEVLDETPAAWANVLDRRRLLNRVQVTIRPSGRCSVDLGVLNCRVSAE
jgi:hypothetical protein